MKIKSVFKNVLLVAICVCLVLGTVGCGEKKGNGETIVWLQRGGAPKDQTAVMEQVNAILMDRLGVKLQIDYIDAGAYTQRLQAYMASGNDYDLAFAGAGFPMVTAASMGGIVPLDELIEENAPELFDAIPDYAWELVKYEGSIYGIPNLQVLPTAIAAVINGDILDASPYTIEDFKSIDDLEPFLKWCKENVTDSKYAYPFVPRTNGETLEAWGYCDDYAKVDDVYFSQNEDGTWKATYKYFAPEYKEQVDRLRDYYEAGYIRPDIASASATTNTNDVVSFEVYKPGLEAEYAIKNEYKKAALINKPVIQKCQSLVVVGKDAKNPEMAVKVIREINTDADLYNLLTIGIEGVNYELLEDGTYRVLDPDNNVYNINRAWAFGNQFNAYVKEGADLDVWEKTAKYNEEAEISPFLGFAIDDANIATEMGQIKSVISKYSAITRGSADPDEYYDTFLAELKTAGVEKVTAEYERQVNEFYAKNHK